MQGSRVLVVEDESALRQSIARYFDRRGAQVVTAASRAEAERVAEGQASFHLAVVDLMLPDGGGLDLMAKLKSSHPQIQVIILTGFGSIENAVECTKRGAFHFMTKPFNLDELIAISERALKHEHLLEENRLLKQQIHQKYRFENIIGSSPEMMKVLELVDQVSDSDSTVLITGESGTGKELIAQAIHNNSPRSEQVLVPVNCGAIPADLLESELFGHVKGAFTGATANRIGRFEVGNKGSIFLDEIGELSLHLQVKILRALQERKFEPVGSSKTVEVDVRIIAATNRDLETMIATNEFREDLYYRLNVIPIQIPPLRERKSDIALLIHHYMGHFNQTKNKKVEGFTTAAMDVLLNYSWPGNVRELVNLIERLAILKGKGIVDTPDLPEKLRRQTQSSSIQELQFELPTGGVDFNSMVDSYENQLILQALEKTGWNRNQAAQLLRLNRTTLVEKIKKKGLQPPPEFKGIA